jgi:hypothetical protein
VAPGGNSINAKPAWPHQAPKLAIRLLSNRQKNATQAKACRDMLAVVGANETDYGIISILGDSVCANFNR